MKFNAKNIIGIILGSFILYVILRNLNWNEFFHSILNFKPLYLLAFIPLYVVNLYIKSYRYKTLINKPDFSASKSFLIFSSSNFLNMSLPCRFGDIWRLFHTGEVTKISKMEVLGAVITEKIFDLFAIIVIFAMIILNYIQNNFALKLIKFSILLLILSVFGIIMLIIINKYKKISFLDNLINGFSSLRDFKSFSKIFLMSFGAKIIESVLVFLLLLGTNIHIEYISSLLVIVFNALSGMIPSISGYIGAYQYSYILSLDFYGISKSISLAIVTIYEVVTLLILAVIASFYYIKILNKKN